MARGDFLKAYWKHRKEGGKLTKKEFAAKQKEEKKNIELNNTKGDTDGSTAVYDS